MDYIGRKIRLSVWLISSFLSRYKRQFAFAFIIGSLAVLAVWQFGERLYTTIVPPREYIGYVGQYEPTNLPRSIQEKISKGLVIVSATGEVLPSLATAWEVNSDGTLYFFHLQKDQVWHDNDMFTAHDVNYQFTEVVIVPGDTHILKIELKEPFAPLPTLLSRPLFKTGLVGLGDYQVVSIELKGNIVDRLIIQPVADGEGPIMDYRFYSSPSKAALAFQLGEVDRIENMPSVSELGDATNVRIEEMVQTDRFMALFFNLQHEAIKSKNFRQALSYATPVLSDKTVLSPISQHSWAYNGSVKEYKYNIDLARTLLQKVDTDTSAIQLILYTFPEYLDMAQQISDSWNSLGVATEVKVAQTFPPDYDVFLGIQEIPSDPDQYPLWHSTQDRTNVTHYNNPKIDKLLEEGRREIDRDKRLNLYLDFQRYLVEDAPAHFLYNPSIYTIIRR